MVRLAIVILLALALVQSVAAAPSFLGFTGLLNVPTADTLNRNEFNLAWFNIDVAGGNQNEYVGNIGLRDGLELGVLRSGVEHGEHETMINAKYRIQPETPKQAALAVGVLDPTDEVQSTVYVVASKMVASRAKVFGDEVTGVRAHIGVGGGRFDGVFAGLSAVLGERLLLAAEWDTNDVNLGARLNLGYGIRAHAAWFDELGHLGVGVSYNKMF